jgi:signal peptidase II
MLWSPQAPLGLAVAAIVGVLDQASKLWLIFGYGLADRGTVRVLPFIDFVLVWNQGISYGLLQQETAFGRGLLLVLTGTAIAVLWIWLVRAPSRLMTLSLGLVIGGAAGNAIDRLHWPGVMDFVLFHITTADFRFSWYVFNLADAAIVAGVAGLLYESLVGSRAAKAP